MCQYIKLNFKHLLETLIRSSQHKFNRYLNKDGKGLTGTLIKKNKQLNKRKSSLILHS